MAYSQIITTKMGPVVTAATKNGAVPQSMDRTSARTAKKARYVVPSIR